MSIQTDDFAPAPRVVSPRATSPAEDALERADEVHQFDRLVVANVVDAAGRLARPSFLATASAYSAS